MSKVDPQAAREGRISLPAFLAGKGVNASDAGFATARHVTADDYAQRYFADRSDGLRPFMTEELLMATT